MASLTPGQRLHASPGPVLVAVQVSAARAVPAVHDLSPVCSLQQLRQLAHKSMQQGNTGTTARAVFMGWRCNVGSRSGAATETGYMMLRLMGVK